MILVTVGTTHFDSLIRAVDRLAEQGILPHKIICQIGSGEYEPRHCEWYRFKPSIEAELNAADLVITHGGFTVLECIWRRKRVIAVANTELTGNHQARFLAALARELPLFWTEDPQQLKSILVEQAVLETPPVDWTPPDLAVDLNAYAEQLRPDH